MPEAFQDCTHPLGVTARHAKLKPDNRPMWVWIIYTMVGFVAAAALLSIIAAVRQSPDQPPTALTRWSRLIFAISAFALAAAILSLSFFFDLAVWAERPSLFFGSFFAVISFFATHDLVIALIDRKVRYLGVIYTRAEDPASYWFSVVTTAGVLVLMFGFLVTLSDLFAGA